MENGKPAKFHFANLSFYLRTEKQRKRTTGAILTVFEPYYFHYSQETRNRFADEVEKHDLDYLAMWQTEGLNLSLDLKKIPDRPTEVLRLRQKGWVFYTPREVGAVEPTNLAIANAVVDFAAMFPLLYVFTSLGDKKKIVGEKLFNSFLRWRWTPNEQEELVDSELYQRYLSEFKLSPVDDKTERKSEAIVRKNFEELLRSKFPTIRPEWLRRRGASSSLELDGYNEELALAFEYQGEYHFIEVPVHHQERSLKEVQKNDQYKRRKCREQGVSLIEIPFYERDNISFLVERLRALRRKDINRLLK